MKKIIPTFITIFLLLGVSFTWNKCTMSTFGKTKASVLQEDIGDAESTTETIVPLVMGSK